LLSVACGALLAAAVVSLAHRFVTLPLATVAGLMTALGSEFVVHGAELRSYELFALLSAALALSVFGVLDKATRFWDVSLAATVAAGCLTHYFFAFSVAAVLGWLWLDKGARQIRRRGTAAVLAGCAVAGLWVPLMLTQYHHGRFRWIGPFRWRQVAAVPLRLFTGAYSYVPIGPILSVSAVVAITFGALLVARRSAVGRLVVILAGFPVAAAAGVWAAGVPIFDLRNLIGVGPYVALLTVVALQSISGRLRTVAASSVVLAISVSLATSQVERIPAYNSMARSLVQSGWDVSKPIVVHGDPYRYRLPFEWYLPRRPVLDLSRALRGACAEVFVISPAGRVTRERLRAPLSSDPGLRHATLLVDPAHRPRCVGVRPRSPALDA
jgi:hypothetical protein